MTNGPSANTRNRNIIPSPSSYQGLAGYKIDPTPAPYRPLPHDPELNGGAVMYTMHTVQGVPDERQARVRRRHPTKRNSSRLPTGEVFLSTIAKVYWRVDGVRRGTGAFVGRIKFRPPREHLGKIRWETSVSANFAHRVLACLLRSRNPHLDFNVHHCPTALQEKLELQTRNFPPWKQQYRHRPRFATDFIHHKPVLLPLC